MNDKGERGELLALKAMEKKGYKLIRRNYICKLGEIDLIMRKGKQLVFVEVKSRDVGSYGRPMESINAQKLKKIERTAQLFLLGYRDPYDSVQLDVCEVFLDSGAVNHVSNVDWVQSSF